MDMKTKILNEMLAKGHIDEEKYRQWLDDEDIPEDDTPESRLFRECLEKLLQTDAWNVGCSCAPLEVPSENLLVCYKNVPK